jgi:hypothetical protein
MYRQNLQLLVEGKSSTPLPAAVAATSVAAEAATSVAATSVAATSVAATSVAATSAAEALQTSVAAVASTSVTTATATIPATVAPVAVAPEGSIEVAVVPLVAAAAPTPNQETATRISDRGLKSRAIDAARALHANVIKHIGMASTEEERKRRVDEKETRKEINKSKKRKVGDRPKQCYQAGDMCGRKVMFQTLKQVATLSDTITIEQSSHREQRIPRNMVVTMILNEVRASSINGGGTRKANRMRKDKPEFILVCDNQDDCKVVLDTFSDIFTRDIDSNKKELYDLVILTKSAKDGKLKTAVEDYVKEEMEKRSIFKSIDLNSIQSKLSDAGVGSNLE